MRQKKDKKDLTRTDQVILDYIKTKEEIDRQIKKARELELTLSHNVNSDGVLMGKVYFYEEKPYTTDLAPTKEDLVKRGKWSEFKSQGLTRTQVKTYRKTGVLKE